MGSVLLTLLLALLAIIYPLIVYFGLQYLEPRYIGLLLLVAFSLRLWLSRQQLQGNIRSLLPVLGLAILCALAATR